MTETIEQRFARICGKLGVVGSNVILLELKARYAEAHRYYHTWAHVEHMVVNLERFGNTDLLFLPILYHDVVYDPKSKTNEEDSVTLFRRHFAPSPATSDINLAAAAIQSTKDHLPSEVYPEWKHIYDLMSDLDLIILGESPEIFRQYCDNVRLEYGFVPWQIYADARGEILWGFFMRHPLYHTPEVEAAFGDRARENLIREVKRLRPSDHSYDAVLGGR